MSILAAVRPDSVSLALFVHVLGAMLLVGALAVVVIAIFRGRRDPERAVALTRFGLRAIPWGVLPAYIVMRVGAQWVEAVQDYPDDFDPNWIGIGYVTADIGLLLTLVSLVLAAIGLKKLRADGEQVPQEHDHAEDPDRAGVPEPAAGPKLLQPDRGEDE